MKNTDKKIKNPTTITRRRALLAGGAMGALFAVLATRMHSLTVKQADQFKLLAEENRVSLRIIPPARGVIRDRNGKILAKNEQNYRLTITKEDSGDTEEVLAKLDQLVSFSPEALDRARRELKKNASFVPITIADHLSWEEISSVSFNTPALPGVSPEAGLSRIYPLADNFSHLIGYVGPVSKKDLEHQSAPDPLLHIPDFQIGKIGIERWLEPELRGASGTRKIEVNALGRVMRELSRNESTPGNDVQLTVESGLQSFAQARMQGESAAAVVIDVQNGDILALASTPSFDPNLFVRGISHRDYNALLTNERRPLANKSVQGLYPPGSTFKMVTALAALEAGVITAESKVFCSGHINIGTRRAHCWKRSGHGNVDLEKSLFESCDVYYYEIAQKVGIDKIAAMGRKLGLGTRYDLPISAIAEGVMPDREWKLGRQQNPWGIGDTINASIGQGYVLSSPLQLAVMTARIASGRLIVPKIVKSVAPANAEDIAPLGISDHYLQKVRLGMFKVINSKTGTARASRITDDTLLWAGKSGTSQVRNISASEREDGVISNEDLPWKQRDHALFVGFVPFENPRYAISVVVEHGGGGSATAAPIARDIILYALYGTRPPLSAYPQNQQENINELLNKLPSGSPLPKATSYSRA